MNDCSKCMYDDTEVTDEPCFRCLSGYFDKKYFKKKLENSKAKVTKKKKEIVFKDENLELPWSS